MQVSQAQQKLNSQISKCQNCGYQNLYYRFVLHKNNKLLCIDCSIQNIQRVQTIRYPYKKYFQNIFKKMPLPYFQCAYKTIEDIIRVKTQTNQIINNLKQKIKTFQKNIQDFYQFTLCICKSYIEKLSLIRESNPKTWAYSSPIFINQNKFIGNIKQRRKIATKIIDKLKEKQFIFPNIQQITNLPDRFIKKIGYKATNITTCTNILQNMYFGCSDGNIIIYDQFNQKCIKAHDSTIRVITPVRGQFRMFSGGDDHKIKEWSISNNCIQLLSTFGHIQNINSFHRHLLLLDNDKIIASSRGQFDGFKIRLWNTKDKSQMKLFLKGHQKFIKGLIANHNGQIISVSQDRYLKIWSHNMPDPILSYFHNCKISNVYLHPYLNDVILVDQLNRIMLLDTRQLNIVIGITSLKKILFNFAGQFIYIQNQKGIQIYDWNLICIKKIVYVFQYALTSIVQCFNCIRVTDNNGTFYEFTFELLGNQSQLGIII